MKSITLFFQLLTKYVAYKYRVKSDFESLKAEIKIFVAEKLDEIKKRKL